MISPLLNPQPEHQKEAEGGVDPRQHREGQPRRRKKELDGGPGVRHTLQLPTELAGGRV